MTKAATIAVCVVLLIHPTAMSGERNANTGVVQKESLVTWQWVDDNINTGRQKLVGPDYYCDGKLLGRGEEGVARLLSKFWSIRDGTVRIATKPIPRPQGSNLTNLPELFTKDWRRVVEGAQAARVTLVIDPSACDTRSGAGKGNGQVLPVPDVETEPNEPNNKGADQPATAPQLKPEGKEIPKPESEWRSR